MENFTSYNTWFWGTPKNHADVSAYDFGEQIEQVWVRGDRLNVATKTYLYTSIKLRRRHRDDRKRAFPFVRRRWPQFQCSTLCELKFAQQEQPDSVLHISLKGFKIEGGKPWTQSATEFVSLGRIRGLRSISCPSEQGSARGF